MKSRDLMTAKPFVLTPTDSIRRAAEVMRNINVGAMPVVQSQTTPILAGIITDRDIAVRCVAEGHAPTCTVSTHMTDSGLQTAEPEDDAVEVIAKMERAQVRRIPVVDADYKLVGIIAQADVARKLGPSDPKLVDEVLEKISAPVASAG